ncbi:energy-coupling factor ABC transporter substrate-binding protein [Acetobacterium sp.]|uniref:energy-coupling factor ABC transporter substrate-binding protein n=1 Tax=Acetobacterium sp. TaxID=1872094 RepID=UPI002F40F111
MKLSLITKIVLVLIIGALIIIPQILLPNATFAGADNKGSDAITSIDPNYKPWFESLFKPGDMEKNLFHFQQALGIGGLIVCFGYLYKKSKNISKVDKSS